MKLFIISVICLFLQVRGQNPLGHWTLQPNVLVLEVDGFFLGQHLLTCLESLEDVMRREDQGQDIIWKKNGEETEQRGNSYQVQLIERLGGGNYTCHNQDGSLLNHTVVLIQELNKNRILEKTGEEYLKCSANNYSGEFRCSWTWNRFRDGKVAFVRARRDSGDGDMPCSVDTGAQQDFSGRGISCLDQQHCPYAEETQQIHFTVYVRSQHFLVEKYSIYFYLSEIVKPDMVRISKVNKTMIEWSYPNSWSSPYSYFPLIFQIEQLRCKKHENLNTECKAIKTELVHSTSTCHFEVKRRVKFVRVRAKDAFCDSQWSEWSLFSLRRRHKKEK
ncbi:hypothetical protein LDENG_00080320 [Lucifuga dentata]|nr:hypothetical protein LDENG_00080320 [Lucifuga dentata]